MRKPIIAANWKLNKGPSDTEDFIKSFESRLADLPKVREGETVGGVPYHAESTLSSAQVP